MLKAKNLKITTLTDNSTARAGTLAEWGLSVFIEAEDRVFLFDTGTTDTAVKNADAIGIDLCRVEAIILSHGHYDHTGGLLPVLKRIGRKDVRVICHPGAMEAKYSYKEKTNTYKYAGVPYVREHLESLGARFELSRKPVWLTDDIAAGGEEPETTDFEGVASNLCVKKGDTYIQDPMEDDQSLYIRTDLGLIVLLGCAHRGMINVIRHAGEIMNTDKVHMVLGGTHLSPASQEQFDKTVEALKKMNVEWLGASHCTGLPASAELASRLKGRFFFNTAGREIRFPFRV